MNRRTLLQYSFASVGMLATSASMVAARNLAQPIVRDVKFKMDLCPSRVGIGAGQEELIDLAVKHGFQAVQPLEWALKKLDADKLAAMNSKVAEAGLVWSAADLLVEFRQTREKFDEGLKGLPDVAKMLQSIGVTRMGTWVMPCHDELSYVANFKQHANRIGEIANVLGQHGIRLGLEYVGTKSLWTSKKYPFLHTMHECRELISETGQTNVGLVLDSWHWTMAGETADDILGLKNEDIVACDLNDAPAGIAADQQEDLVRELPMATGVIDTKAFLQSLVDVGYDGPVRAEPFNKPLNELDDESAAAKTAETMKQAFALVGG